MEYCSCCMKPLENGRCPDGCTPASIPPHILPPGTVLNGRYLLGAPLGQGGFGITYIGRDQVLDIRVAIKEYYPSGFVTRSAEASPDVVVTSQRALLSQESEKFLAEARVLAKFIREQGIVEVRDYFRANNTAYIVMEYLDGQTLREALRNAGRLTPAQTFTMMEPLMRSLDKVHQAGLIHRDISPDNIMLPRSGGVKLLDFGTARIASPTGEKSLSIMLKPGYAPEEQYRSKGSQGPWTDIYALCATMYRCITGVTPLDSLQRLFEDTVEPPSRMGISMEPDQEAALMKGMACHQKDRFQSVRELAAALGMSGFGEEPVPLAGVEKPVFQRDLEDPNRTLMADEGVVMETPLEKREETVVPPQDTPREEAVVPPQTPPPVKRQEEAVVPPQDTPPERPHKQTAQNDLRRKAQNPPENPRKPDTLPPPRRKRKLLLPLLIGLGGLLVLGLVVSAVWRAGHVVNTGGESYTDEDTLASFSRCTVTAEDLEKLTRLPDIHWISFYTCDFAPGALEALGGMEQVDQLSFDGDCTNLPALDPLAANPNLVYISLSCKVSPAITTDFPQLASLYISMAGDMDNLDFLSHMPNLTTLSFRSCDKDEARVADFSPIGQLTKLTRLNLSDSGVTDISFLSNLTELEELDLSNDGDDGYYYRNEISGLAPLAGCARLTKVEAENVGLTSLAGLEGSAAALRELTISNNAVASLTPLAGCGSLGTLYANNNALTSLEGLEGAASMHTFYADRNQIASLAPLAGLNLINLHLNHNQISDLTPLASSEDMKDLQVGYNSLSSLAGCESLLRLEILYANDNQLTSINALTNCTVLEEVQLSYNSLTDISLLGKSGENLTVLEAGHNALTSLSGLESCTRLQVLNCGENQISSLAPLATMAELRGLRACGNRISDLSPLEQTPLLAYLDLGHNQIESIHSLSRTPGLSYLDVSFNQISDISPLANLSDTYSLNNIIANTGGVVLYLEHNRIEDISPLPETLSYWKLSLYGNPLKDLSHLSELEYANVTFGGIRSSQRIGAFLPYIEGLDYSPLRQSSCPRVYMIDTPLDQQVNTERAIRENEWNGADVSFCSMQEFDGLLAGDKPRGIIQAGPEEDPDGGETGAGAEGGESVA